jgi:hypothetical protein
LITGEMARWGFRLCVVEWYVGIWEGVQGMYVWFWRLNLLRFDQWYAYKIPQNRENLIFFLLFLKPEEVNIL